MILSQVQSYNFFKLSSVLPSRFDIDSVVGHKLATTSSTRDF
jgi:pyruvoyl-dependent arginine decarboxylase (PvlArgDC)